MRPITASPKSLNDLASYLGLDARGYTVQISGVTTDSREIQPGDLFIALPGAVHHGIEFLPQALDKGAVAVLSDRGDAEVDGRIPFVKADQPTRVAGLAAAWFYDFPFHRMHTVGVTGTNGKTTTSSLLEQIWSYDNRITGFIGTTGIRIGRDAYPARFTTPQATQLQESAAVMAEQHVTHLVMEVSSHALDQSRVAGSHYNSAAFTNLTQDHLDYHGTMERYFEAKAKLFRFGLSDVGFINIDDPYGRRLADNCEIPVISISRKDASADWHYADVAAQREGYRVSIRGTGGVLIEGLLPLLGEYNLDNALMAVALAIDSGVDPMSVQASLPELRGAPGRLESVQVGQSFAAIVDFAHTPDAVTQVLRALRASTPGRLIAVLGCGGDRDRTKRPIMGRLLDELSDVAVFTSDNPRSEDPEAILNEMVGDLKIKSPSQVIADRRAAIQYAVQCADEGDTVAILGKGHELGQEIAGVKHPFDDRLELAKAIEVKP